MHDILDALFTSDRAASAKTKNNKNTPCPYIFQHFNICGFYPRVQTQGLMRFINPLIEALNKHHCLPKILVIVPDKDILRCIQSCESFRAARFIGAVVHYLIKQVNMLISRRKQDLETKRIGTLVAPIMGRKEHDDQDSNDIQTLKVVWIRMVRRPKSTQKYNELFNLCGKFNSILEERILEDGQDMHHIMSIDVPEMEFNFAGHLTSHGKTIFWNEVNRGLMKFYLGDITLNPRKSQSTSNPQPEKPMLIKHLERVARNSRICAPPAERKLPTPPKSRRRLDFNVNHARNDYYKDKKCSRERGRRSHSPKYHKRHASGHVT